MQVAGARFEEQRPGVQGVREQLELHIEKNVSPAILYDARVLAQSTVDAIIEQACDTGSDVIVMGTHGRSGIGRLLIGSVTEAVIRLATVPVIAVNGSCCDMPDIDAIVAPVATTAASYEAQRYASAFSDESVLLEMPGKPSPDQIAHFAREMQAGLIAVDGNLPSLSSLLHLSPCPVLTVNERTVRQPHATTAVS